jgi:hypothetical protein
MRAPEGSTANFDIDVNEAPPPVNGFFTSTGFTACRSCKKHLYGHRTVHMLEDDLSDK